MIGLHTIRLDSMRDSFGEIKLSVLTALSPIFKSVDASEGAQHHVAVDELTVV